MSYDFQCSGCGHKGKASKPGLECPVCGPARRRRELWKLVRLLCGRLENDNICRQPRGICYRDHCGPKYCPALKQFEKVFEMYKEKP